jgi:hypothetical protein
MVDQEHTKLASFELDKCSISPPLLACQSGLLGICCCTMGTLYKASGFGKRSHVVLESS